MSEMTITNKELETIRPYEGNAKIHTERQINQIAESIQNFGFNDPIGIDEHGMIIEGHGRYEAAKKLGMTEVPCIVLEGLTDEQKKAYILIHNKLTMNTGFDLDLLNSELEGIKNIDMEFFDFELPEQMVEDEENGGKGFYGDERQRTNSAYNLAEYDEDRTAGFYQMPILESCDYVPEKLIGFNYVLTTQEVDAGVHFFIDDYQFERIWNDPATYIPKLAEFECVLTPDFSLYLDMPMAMKVWNVYRSRLIGQMMQDVGINVIPTLQWAEPETFSFCFDGIEPGGTVAVSTVGVMRDKGAQEIWKMGMNEAVRRIKPKTVLCYGARIDYGFDKISDKIDVRYYEARKGWN